MRRLVMAVLLTAGLTLPAACGGGDDESFALPTVSSSVLGTDPTIVSTAEPPTTSQIKVLSEGTGHPVGAHDLLVTNTKGQVWSKDGAAVTAFTNTFAGKKLLFTQLDQTVAGWVKLLPGVKVGSRVLMVNPPADGFGDAGNPTIKVEKGDTLVWVVDIVDSIALDAEATGSPASAAANAAQLPTVSAGKNPTIIVPEVAAPKDLVVQPLLTGTGPKVKQGEVIIAQYTGAVWSGGRVFDSSWKEGREPFSTRVARGTDTEAGVMKGWVQGLAGQRVGSRVLLVVPPAFGYGKEGKGSAGIKGTDTLVFVIDILGVYGDPTKALFVGTAAGPA